MSYKVDISNIHGSGVVATSNIPNGELIGIWLSKDKNNIVRYLYQDGMTSKWYEIGNLGRYCNHQINSNVSYKKQGNSIELISKGILIGEEITVNYQWANIIAGFYVDITNFMEL